MAYEMRISDWSSDVCSSDLSGVRLSPGQERLWRVTAAGALPENLAIRARFAWTGRAPDRAAVADALRQLVRRHEILRTCFHSLSEMDVPLQAALDPGSRSEEHTSELQSLMRISYAVFCLKKKTQLNKEHTECTVWY